MTREEFETESLTYFKRNYMDQNNDQIIEPIVINENENIVKLLGKLCDSLNQGSSELYLICKYNPSHHFEFFKYTCLKKKLQDGDCYFAYMKKQNVFLIIQTAKGLKNPKDELDDSFINAALFYQMNKELLEGSNACIMAFVAAPDIKEKDFASPEDIAENHIDTNLFLFFEKTSDEKEFVKFLSEKIEAVKRFRKTQESNDSNIFIDMCSRVLAYLAIVKDYLPIFLRDDDRSSHVESRYLVLYKKQRETLDTPRTHIIITGHNGSGKTMLAMLKLERTLEESNESSIIYYISHNPLSIIDSYMKNFSSPKISRKIINVLNLKKRLSDALKELRKQHLGQKLHVIVDEYDGEELTEEEAGEIKNLLDNDFKECMFVLIPHTMKAIRKKNNIECKTHCLKETGLDIYKLPYTMRTTVHINELIKVAEEMVSREERKLYLGKELDGTFSSNTEERESDVNEIISAQSKNDNIEKRTQHTVSDNRSDWDKESSDRSDLNKESEDLSDLNEDETISCEPDLDEALRIVKRYWYFRSNFNVKFIFGNKSILGHSIGHEKPVLKKFIKSNDLKKNAFAWFFLCTEIRKKKGGDLFFVCVTGYRYGFLKHRDFL